MVGKKRQEKRMGYAADFCRICREFQPIVINRVDIAGHIDDIPLEKAQTIGFSAVCQVCGFDCRVDPFRFEKLLPASEDSVALLIDETYPDAYLDHAQRLFLEGDIRRNPRVIDADLRRALVKEPFLLLSNQVPYPEAVQATPLVLGGIAAAILGPLGIACLRLTPVRGGTADGGSVCGRTGGYFLGHRRGYTDAPTP